LVLVELEIVVSSCQFAVSFSISNARREGVALHRGFGDEMFGRVRFALCSAAEWKLFHHQDLGVSDEMPLLQQSIHHPD